ncbi:MAG TPA: rhodanese-like domain-containing protein, partial [Longimicrobiales bacterium]|nr:rhodanese-like domain-containing protein [Longimicrobiales bacterium]
FQVEGHLEGGLAAWKAAGQPVETLPIMDVDALKERLDGLQVLDVREGFEYRHGHIAGALHLPWTETWERADEARGGKPLAVVCGDEVRSAAAASVLKRAGLEPTLVVGGMVDWLERGYPVEKGPAGGA